MEKESRGAQVPLFFTALGTPASGPQGLHVPDCHLSKLSLTECQHSLQPKSVRDWY